ncbi:MAG: hypothetical protein U0Q16_04135 [Bryobacteraceae bacterium]
MTATLLEPVLASAPTSRATEPVVVVASSDREDWSTVRTMLAGSGYGVIPAPNFRELERALYELPVAAVVTSDRPFGRSWRDIALRLESERRRPSLIVCSHQADESLWLDVLDSGGYDVFAKPLPPSLFRDRVDSAVADWLWLR